MDYVIAAFVILAGSWLIAGVFLARDHARAVRDCQQYLRDHEGEDADRDRRCWTTLHEGQG